MTWSRRKLYAFGVGKVWSCTHGEIMIAVCCDGGGGEVTAEPSPSRGSLGRLALEIWCG